MEREQYAEAAFPRVAWGPIFAGGLVGFVMMFILNTFGLAVGLTGQEGVGTGFAIWAIVVALGSLFVGGYVMSYLDSGSKPRQFVMIHGVVLWGLVVFGLSMLAITGMQMGITAIFGTASAVSGQLAPGDLANLANQLGVSEQEIRGLQDQAAAAMPGAPSAWWSLVAMVVSLGAVIAGAVSGSNQRPPSSMASTPQQESPFRRSDRTSA